MKILLCNYRYFLSGGPERYMFNVIDSLTKRDHEVIPFSVQYTRNQSTPYSRFFVEPLGGQDQVYFREQKMNLKTLGRTLARLFYAPDVEKAITRLMRETRPDVAYVLHYLRKLSPSLLVGLKRAGVPIVVRLSDYAMLCPQAHFLRENTPCELCINGNLLPSIQYRCVQNSVPASVLNVLATYYHQKMRFFDSVDVFVTTNRFMYQKMLAAGYSEQRLCYIPTFVNSSVFHPVNQNSKEKYVTYVGRIEKIKAVHVLIKAVAVLRSLRPDFDLVVKIAGSGDQGYMDIIKQQIQQAGLEDSIQLLGELKEDEIVQLLNKALLSIVPSLWYENLPNSILESYACGTPVLASKLGSLAECVNEGQTGYLFRPGDADDLAQRLIFCLDRPEHLAEMSFNARQVAETIYSEDAHLSKLETLFVGLRKKNISNVLKRCN